MIKFMTSMIVAIALMTTAVSQSAFAEDAPRRCSLLAQLGTSNFLAMVGSLSSGNEDVIDRYTERFAHYVSSYRNLSCDTDAMERVIDCVIEASGSGTGREVALQCLVAEGLAKEQ